MLSSSLKYVKPKYLMSCCTKVFTYYFKFFWCIFTEEGNPLAFFLSSRPYYGSMITHQLFSSGLMFPDIFSSGACCRRFELCVPHPAKSQSRAVRMCRASSEQAGSPHNNTYKEDKISRLPTQNPCGGSISQHPWVGMTAFREEKLLAKPRTAPSSSRPPWPISFLHRKLPERPLGR